MNDSQQLIIDQAQSQRDIINETSRHVRNVVVMFVLFAVYLAIIIGGTTDKQLLLISPITLPILNVPLPIVGFYQITPGLFLLMHFHMLLQLYLLSRKLHQFNTTAVQIESNERRQQLYDFLFSFPFNHALTPPGINNFRRWLSLQITWVIIVLLPLAILIWMMIRFIAFHDVAITHGHRITILLDLLIMLLLIPAIVTPTGRIAAWWRRPFYYLFSIFGKEVINGEIRAKGASVLCLSLLGLLVILASATIPEEEIEQWLVAKAPQSWIEKDEASKLTMLTTTATYFHNGPFYRNLDLREAILISDGKLDPKTLSQLTSEDASKRESAHNRITGINLRMRDLRYANFTGAKLPAADLRGANLDGATFQDVVLTKALLEPFISRDGVEHITSANNINLINSSLHGANLNGAELNGANLRAAELNGANLRMAKLNDATLSVAKFNGANLSGAELNGAYLIGADLNGADLRRAKLNDANLSEANLNGANLSEANLNNAKLRSAQFNNANLYQTQLNDAYLIGANLNGADLRRAKLNGANLSKAKLNGANLSGAELNGANLSSAQLNSTYLSMANLNGAYLSMANLNAADLRRAKLNGAYLRRAQLNGADLLDADLNGTDLREAELNGAKLYRTQLNGANLEDTEISGANIEYSNFSLANLSSIKTTLTAAEYGSTTAKFIQTIDDPLKQNAFINTLSQTKITPNFEDARAEASPLCRSKNHPFKNCLDREDKSIWKYANISYRSQLACSNSFILKSIVDSEIKSNNKTSHNIFFANAILLCNNINETLNDKEIERIKKFSAFDPEIHSWFTD